MRCSCTAQSATFGFTIGLLTALTQPNPEALRRAIRETRKLTSKNFGVNITLLPSINPPDYAGYARAAVEEGVRVFETAGNNREFFSLFDFGIVICTSMSLSQWFGGVDNTR